ncbi:hypothetical protein ACFUGD_00400 [Streptomyces sp. NPDC057217]|uniref:hypothetical protein n=1 Tax=Streptomyces sp. NPDC057217 TaxID=3346054 RepID=UPI00363F2C97
MPPNVQENRRDTPVASVMVQIEDVPTPHPDDRLTEVLPALESSPAHRAVVVEGDAVVCVLTSSDISRVTSWLASSGWRQRAI